MFTRPLQTPSAQPAGEKRRAEPCAREIGRPAACGDARGRAAIRENRGAAVRLRKRCAGPGCAVVVEYPDRLCADCERQAAAQRQARGRRHDEKRRAGKPWRGWYNTKRWEKLRQRQLARAPLCAYCARRGVDRLASVADHIQPHGGHPKLFWCDDNLQSLCKSCHDSVKQSEERQAERSGAQIDATFERFVKGGRSKAQTPPREDQQLGQSFCAGRKNRGGVSEPGA